jgi:D-alanyl-lipoteichoic acid acyltransferase DltB (MBOAT superfamily)
LNFHSPYKSVNIIEFWRHWHMTLSRFLRDYLYIPLGGNRHGTTRRYLNLMITMLLGGLWHGAGWTFVIWGGLHGLYLAINHAWHALRRMLGQDPAAPLSWIAHALSVLLTFASVTIAWVFFRASDLHTATTLVQTMLGFNGVAPPDNGLAGKGMINWIAILLLIVWLAPNTQTIMRAFNPALDAPRTKTRLAWRASGINAWVLGLMAGVTLLCLTNTTEFIYHQF